jgi:hypothetical protein
MEQTNGHTNTWATEAEIMAASETFNCEIFIKTIVDGNFSWIRHSIKLHTYQANGHVRNVVSSHMIFLEYS